MRNPLDILGNIFGGRGGGIGGIGGTPGYEWEKWEGEPEWATRQRQMMNRSAQEMQQSAEQQRRYYQGQQQGQFGSMIPAATPELDAEHKVTQALVLLFGDHWEIINEELKRLEVDTPMRPLPRIGSPMW